ncbi:MAG TPA: hypothetical protein VHZ25_07520 [Acidobacteriaceae bacterium]|jgi:hypothetical protein|nr:hypothetical protein [Acidobacteriaceae bacterium]
MLSRRILQFFSAPCFALLLGSAAQAQKALHNDDVSIGGFYQLTSDASGNGISDTTTRSLGGEAAFRHSFNPLMGYEASYDYSRFTEYYTGQPFGYQHNLHQFNGDYYIHGARAFGVQPFAVAGISAVIYSPSLNGGQNVAWQARPGANFGAGINMPLLTSYFGLRIQYRGVYSQAPDFSQAKLTTNAWRLTSEPLAGIYIRF